MSNDHESPSRLLTAQLNGGSLADMQRWLLEALNGRAQLPQLSPDEFPYLGILRIDKTLDKPTRQDLRTACLQLALEFIRDCKGDPAYVNALFHLAVELDLGELAAPLAALAREFPQRSELAIPQRKLLLATLIDLKVQQPAKFWQDILKQDPAAFAGVALSGLLVSDRADAVQSLPFLPVTVSIVDAVVILLDQTTSQLTFEQRARFIEQIQAVLPRCHMMLQSSLKEWLTEIGEPLPAKKAKDYSLLDRCFRAINANFSPKPAVAKLCGAH